MYFNNIKLGCSDNIIWKLFSLFNIIYILYVSWIRGKKILEETVGSAVGNCAMYLSETTSHGLQSMDFAFIHIVLATIPPVTIVLRLILMSLLSYLIWLNEINVFI